MHVEIIKVGALKANCYLIINEGKCLIVDPGDDYFLIEPRIKELNVIGVLVTHSHEDHIGALDDVQEHYPNIPVYKKDNLEEKKYEVEGFKFEVIFTPGHSKDSISFYFYEYNFIFSGDFIFKDTVGRFDLEGGDLNEMITSIKRITTYNEKMKIYPGHGVETTLVEEMRNNYYIRKYM